MKNSPYQPSRNTVTNINGRTYRGHALDQMQNRGIPSSIVEETIQNGKVVNVNPTIGTTEYYDATNKIKVVLNNQDEIVTVIRVSGE